jgi:dihydroneopterin aldolase/D-erythro-7,8-dihydroneopterin triphosphate epimerase
MNKPLDQILIRDLVVACIVGTRPAERTRRRKVVLDLTLFCDLARAGQTDDLRHTVDYAAVCHSVTTMASRSRYQLLERLAQEVANTCLAFPGVAGVTVTLDKPGAVRGARSMAVEITRGNRN